MKLIHTIITTYREAFSGRPRLVWSLGEMLNLPMVNAVVAARAGRPAAGRYMGAYTLSFATAFVVSPLIGSAIYQRLGPSVLWYGIGCCGLLLFAGFQVLSRRFR
ncbi:MAG: hypothetical protein ABFS37_15290 [Acidobacteriota bacterium]